MKITSVVIAPLVKQVARCGCATPWLFAARSVYQRHRDLCFSEVRGCHSWRVIVSSLSILWSCRNCAIPMSDCATKIGQWTYVATVASRRRIFVALDAYQIRNRETIKRDITHLQRLSINTRARISESVNHIPADYHRQFRIDPVARLFVLFVGFNFANDFVRLANPSWEEWWNLLFRSVWNTIPFCYSLLLECNLVRLFSCRRLESEFVNCNVTLYDFVLAKFINLKIRFMFTEILVNWYRI